MITSKIGMVPDRDYFSVSISERDMSLRRVLWYGGDYLPEGELGRIRKTGRGGAVYDLMESLRGMGVRLDQLCGMGVLVWGFFDSNLYEDEWVLEVWGSVERCGGVDGVLTRLERMGVDRDLLYMLRSLGVMVPDGVSLPLSVGLAKIGDWSEADWYAEVGLLMEDAKNAGDKGFGVRKELLLMVGKKLGFIAPDVGDIS